MRFAHPEILWLLLLLPLLGLFIWARLRSARTVLSKALGDRMAARLTDHLRPNRSGLSYLLLVLALFFLILATAEPQRGTQYATASRQGVDVIVALDLSESMLAEDLRPNRLLRARHEISGIVDRLKGDRIGLIAFAGAAFVQCPLTMDYAAARMFLEFMGTDLIPEPGTSIAEAIRVATGAFDAEGEGFKALILITDGEDHIGEIEKAVKDARKASVRIFTVGIGSESGEPIPLRNENGEIDGYKKDSAGKVILSRLNETVLRDIAEQTGGLYVRAGGTLGLDRVLDGIESMEKREIEGGVRMLYEERYSYFLVPAIFLLLIQWWIPSRRRLGIGPGSRFTGRRAPAPVAGRLLSIVLATLVLGVATTAAQMQHPPTTTQPQGQPPLMPPGAAVGELPGLGDNGPKIPEEEWLKLLEENQVYRTENPDDPRPIYNLGNLYHLKGDLPEAGEFYSIAAGRSEEGPLASSIAYNMGNTLAREGKLQEARDAFAHSLFIEPGNGDAKFNLELVQKMIDQAQQCPDSSCQNQDDQQQDQENQDDQQPDQQNQDDQQSDQQNQDDQQSDQQNQDDQQPDQQNQDDQQPDQQEQNNEPDQQNQDEQKEQNGQNQEEQQQEQQEQPQSPADQQQSQADSTMTAEQMQLMQILKGLEASEKELLEQKFQARSTNQKVEKDW